MNPFGMGPVTRVVNRVVDQDGHRVPFEAMLGGEALRIIDHVDLPVALARIAIQQSMYKIDPVTNLCGYRLGSEEFNLPVDDLPVAETQRLELIDRELLPPDRHFGAKDKQGRTLKPVKIHNPIRRMDPLAVSAPGPNDNGALPGTFGEKA